MGLRGFGGKPQAQPVAVVVSLAEGHAEAVGRAERALGQANRCEAADPVRVGSAGQIGALKRAPCGRGTARAGAMPSAQLVVEDGMRQPGCAPCRAVQRGPCARRCVHPAGAREPAVPWHRDDADESGRLSVDGPLPAGSDGGHVVNEGVPARGSCSRSDRLSMAQRRLGLLDPVWPGSTTPGWAPLMRQRALPYP